MKIFFKWFLRILLFLVLLLLGVGVYFYYYPTYPNYNISDEYFHTRFHEEGFDSPNNGFEEWRILIESLDEEAELISEFDMYYKCYFQDACHLDLEDLDELEKEKKLEEILENNGKMESFGRLIESFLNNFSEITQKYDYISTLNYSRDIEGNIPVGSELLIYTKMIQLSRAMLFYNHYSGEKKLLNNITSYYKSLSWLSNNMDDGISSYLLVITILNTQFNYIEENLEDFPLPINNLLLVNIKSFEISNNMLQNGMKSEHQFGEMLISNLYYGTLNSINNESGKSLMTLLFFDIEDTLNLMNKLDSDKIEGICHKENWVKINGKNWIGRTLAKGWGTCMSSQLQKQTELLKKREVLIQLLSN